MTLASCKTIKVVDLTFKIFEGTPISKYSILDGDNELIDASAIGIHQQSTREERLEIPIFL